MAQYRSINPRKIKTRGEYNSRFGNGYNQKAIDNYRRNGYSDRVIVERATDGTLYAIDGSHRVRADRKAGRNSKVVIYEQGTVPGASTGDGCLALVLLGAIGLTGLAKLVRRSR
jgi:hypothetical protein